MLRKQLKELTASTASEAESLTKSLKEKETALDNLKVVVEASKKEDNAVEALSAELERRNAEKSELQEQISKLQADVESKEYDVKRTKEEKETLMAHYDQVSPNSLHVSVLQPTKM